LGELADQVVGHLQVHPALALVEVDGDDPVAVAGHPHLGVVHPVLHGAHDRRGEARHRGWSVAEPGPGALQALAVVLGELDVGPVGPGDGRAQVDQERGPGRQRDR
jgi:hypothetical protein